MGNRIYSKLYNLSKSNKNNENAKNIYIKIKVSKEKKATAKDSTGKILEYKINLNTKIVANNYLPNDELLHHNFASSLSYKVQEQFSETLKSENKSIDDLINKTSEEILFSLTKNIADKW